MIWQTQRSFVADGAGSIVFALATEGNTPLAPTQRELTPLQRLVMIEGFRKQQEQINNSSQSQPQPGLQRNTMARPFGGGSSETVTFVRDKSNE